jgi:nudix-type nucleoside diphosphatase (YffH/AdpP family)
MNEKVSIKKTDTLSKEKYTLTKVTFERTANDGTSQEHTNEVYDMGNAVTILLYDPARQTVILTRQFRLPSYFNGNNSGILVEACAGKIENESPEQTAKREIEEETGYRVSTLKKIYEAYTSPGTITELLHFFVAEYNPSLKVSEGGGSKREKEDVEVMEVPFEQATQMVQNGDIKDAKTILLLLYAKLHFSL